jgi:hypothetical protein
MVSAGVSLSGILHAHDPSQHKGKPVTGEVESVAASQFRLKTASGTVIVSIMAQTEYERGKEVHDKSLLKQGEKVSVFGTKLASGELVAKEVLWSPPNRKRAPAQNRPAGTGLDLLSLQASASYARRILHQARRNGPHRAQADQLPFFGNR